MARYIKTDHITVGDFIEVMGDVYVAAMQTAEDCRTQCDFYDEEKGICRGTCYRYDEEGIVFKHYGSLREIKGGIRICETRCWDKVKDKLLKAEQCRRSMEMRRFPKSESDE